ncbi:MAG TPA: hypothetical protein VMI35_00635, partial [Puia sp.]|nr:hypothetical protein [Puia sp.]
MREDREKALNLTGHSPAGSDPAGIPFHIGKMLYFAGHFITNSINNEHENNRHRKVLQHGQG